MWARPERSAEGQHDQNSAAGASVDAEGCSAGAVPLGAEAAAACGEDEGHAPKDRAAPGLAGAPAC